MNYLFGDKNKKSGETLKNLEDEPADLLFIIVCIANDQNIFFCQKRMNAN